MALALALLVAAATLSAAAPTPPPTADAAPRLAAWYAGYRTACEQHEPWRALLASYSARHARAMLALRRGDFADCEEPTEAHGALVEADGTTAPSACGARRPAVSVYRVPPRGGRFGVGCLLPGMANVVLSSLFRDRIFLLDWPSSEAALGAPPRLEVRAHDWSALLGLLGPGATAVHWEQRENISWWGSDDAPRLWGDPAFRDFELWDNLNRGAYSDPHRHKTAAEEAWLARVLPRDSAGGLMFGCVYQAVAPLTAEVVSRAAALVPSLPAARPPELLLLPPPKASLAPPPLAALVCLHVRTWNLEPGVTEPEAPRVSKYVQASFACLEKVLAAVGGADTAVFVASDDAKVRTAARKRFGSRARAVLSSTLRPAHTAFLTEAESDVAVGEVFSSALSEWLLLAQCPVLVSSVYSGFSRSAAAATWGSALYFSDDEEGSMPACRRWEGVMRERIVGVGAGW